jgi:hypothetical protein
MLYSYKFMTTYRSVQRNTVANQDFFAFSGPAPFSAIGLVIEIGLATSLLTAAAGFGIPKASAVVAVVEVVAQLLDTVVSAPAF